MAIKRFEPTVQLDNGLIIPASAGVGKILSSDASGNATWQPPAVANPTTLSYMDVAGHSLPAGGGAVPNPTNGYVTRLAAMLGVQKLRDSSIGGAVSCWRSNLNVTGDGGYGHVMEFLPLPKLISAGWPFQPQSNIAIMHMSINDLASLGSGGPIPMQEAHRTILARLAAAAVSPHDDTVHTYTGTWATTALYGVYTPGISNGLPTDHWTSTLNDQVSIAFPQISKAASGSRYIGFTVICRAADDLTLGVTLDGVAQPDVRLQGSAICDQFANGTGPSPNAVTRRYSVNATVTHTLIVKLKTQTIAGSQFLFDSSYIEADPADGPVIVVPNCHRCVSYGLYNTAGWHNGPTMTDSSVTTWNPLVQSVVNEFGHTLWVDIDTALNKQAELFYSDGVHPSNHGHAKIAETIFNALVGNNLITSRRASAVTATLADLWWILGLSINSVPAFQNSWANFGSTFPQCSYRRDFVTGRVYLRGFVKSGTAVTAVVFTLPASYRPALQTSRPGAGSVVMPTVVGGVLQQVTVDQANGNVNFSAGGNVTNSNLEGVSFDAEV